MISLTRFAVAFALTAVALAAQGWSPAHIEALTDYPRFAWITKRTGDVVIQCTLDGNGAVIKAEALSGPSLLNEAAIGNAALWKFRRVSPKGGKTLGSFTITYQFRLEGGPKDTPHCSFVVDLPNVVRVVAPFPVPMID